jgi:rhamnogalacturonan endolyase
MLSRTIVAVFAILAACSALVTAQGEVLRYEAEDVSGPAEAWQVNRGSDHLWNLWSTDVDADKKWSGGTVLRSPEVHEDRASAEAGAPPLHTLITDIPAGTWSVEIRSTGRPLGVSFDGETWQKQSTALLGEFTIEDGRFELWVDDRYAAAQNTGAAYYDCLIFTPAMATRNGVKNGDFEFTSDEGIPAWTWWTREEGAGTATITGEAHSGENAILIAHTGERDFALSNAGRRSVTGAEKLTATAWVRAEGAGTVNVALVGLAEGKVVTWSIGGHSVSGGTDGWVQLQGYCRVPRNIDQVQLRVTGSGVVQAVVDDIAIVDGWLPAQTGPPKPLVQGRATERVVDRMDRGLVATPMDGNRVYVGWRLLADDPEDVGFHVYRWVERQQPERLTEQPIADTCDFVDESPIAGTENYYVVRAVTGGAEGGPSNQASATPAEQARLYLSIPLQGDYRCQKVGVGDLDGNGRYDFVIKQPHENVDPYELYWYASPDTYKLEAYLADGTFLWRKDLGWGIERGVWYSPYLVHDLDGDGRAEVIAKTGPEGDPRDADGRVTKGPEWLSILDGMTGEELARVDWPSRDLFPTYNVASRNLMCIAYLDGKTPCVVVDRGTYNVMIVVAYQFHDGKLQELWRYTDAEGGGLYRGQGAHSMHAVDVDEDGRDEVFLGSAVLDDNGSPLWSTGLGHPDHHYVGDIDPTRPGLEVYYGIETRQGSDGCSLYDARTGEWLWGLDEPTTHVHATGLCADIDPRYPGMECYSGERDLPEQKWLWSAQGELIDKTDIGGLGPRNAYWDADLQRELVRGSRIVKFRGPTMAEGIEGSIIGYADILGDWREELVTSLPGEIRIYTTNIRARDRRVCLMQDPLYRNDVTIQAMGYLQCPMTSTCLSAGEANLGLIAPREGIRAGEQTGLEVVLTAPVAEALDGVVHLSAEGPVRLAEAQMSVNVQPGESMRYPLNVTLAMTGTPFAIVPGMIHARYEGPGGPLETQMALQPVDEPLLEMPRVQAEAFAAQSGGEVQIREDKVGADGTSFSHWDANGHTLEWVLPVETAGRYLLAVRYCTPETVRRQVALDGEDRGRFTFPATGGFSSDRSDWRHEPLRGSGGKPLVLELGAGEHRVSMSNADGKGMNLDYLLLVPAE